MKIILDKMYVCLFIFKLGQKKRSIELHMNSPHKLNKFTGKIVAAFRWQCLLLPNRQKIRKNLQNIDEFCHF